MRHLAGLAMEHAGLTAVEFFSRGHQARVVRPRQMFMVMARAEGFSTTQIGRFLGLDHSTVIHGCKAVARREERARLAGGDE